MSRRALKTDDEQGFLLAVSDDWAENEQLFDVHVYVELKRTNRRGHFEIVCRAVSGYTDTGEPIEVVTRTPYPSVSANRLHAGLYRALIAIGGALARTRTGQPAEDSP